MNTSLDVFTSVVLMVAIGKNQNLISKEMWTSYAEHLGLYLTANKIKKNGV